MAMVKDVMYGKTLRKSYAKHDDDRILEIPNLLKIQKDSYERFCQKWYEPNSFSHQRDSIFFHGCEQPRFFL